MTYGLSAARSIIFLFNPAKFSNYGKQFITSPNYVSTLIGRKRGAHAGQSQKRFYKKNSSLIFFEAG